MYRLNEVSRGTILARTIQKQETAADASHYETRIVDFTLYVYISLFFYLFIFYLRRGRISRMRNDARRIVDCVEER